MQRAARGAPSAARLRAWARAAAAPGTEVTLRVVGAAEARLLNRAFRKRDTATNVLSFAYSKRHGDVVLCHPVIAREARAQGKTLAAHYAHLVVHGMLHLRGLDHARAADARRMERRETMLLARLGFGDPYTVE
ncbi:MAG TPA: rRNA maturation RNase YbeY [Burkholderiales bacterium]|nr:rRNA maturation RNase YbeY [Burkholderiales bacterium]